MLGLTIGDVYLGAFFPMPDDLLYQRLQVLYTISLGLPRKQVSAIHIRAELDRPPEVDAVHLLLESVADTSSVLALIDHLYSVGAVVLDDLPSKFEGAVRGACVLINHVAFLEWNVGDPADGQSYRDPLRPQ